MCIYIFEGAGKHLCIWLSNIYDRYTRYRKDYAITGEVLSVNQFYQQLQHSDYFIAKHKPKRIGNTVRRVWVLDYEKLAQNADIHGFMEVEPEKEV